MNQQLKIIIISAIIAALVGGGSAFFIQKLQKPSRENLIKEFYDIENAVHASAHGARIQLDKGGGNFILVDLRSPQEYEREHIISAVNIPAYTDPNTSAYEEKDRIIKQFRELINANPGKEIVTYCYSVPCMTARKIGKILAEDGVYVKTLTVGWNEWRYFWNLWNHDGEAPTKVEDYIISGKEPGTPKIRELLSPCGEGEFGC